MTKKIIYHCPFPLNSNALSASGIRPVKLLEGFKNLGYEVDVISGYATDRKKSIKEIKNRIKAGITYDLCYSESSTMPTLLTEKNHLPFHPFVDFNFFKLCKKNNIPIKLFYRDIYWCFPDYYKQVGIKGYIAKIFYLYDIYMYIKYLDTLYVPCNKMLDYIPRLKKLYTEELPSGCFITNNYEKKEYDKMNLIYVGGIGNHYSLSLMIESVSKFEKATLYLCVRENDWNAIKSSYHLSNNIILKHISGKELSDLYSVSNISMLFVEPSIYWEFAIPYKLFEYIGYGLPIIASENTAVGDYVKKYNIGWTIPYTSTALTNLLEKLKNDVQEINDKTKGIREHGVDNTWEMRCKQILGERS